MTDDPGFKPPAFIPCPKMATLEMLARSEDAGKAMGFNVASGTAPAKAPKHANPRLLSLVLEKDVYQRLAARGLRRRMKMQTMIEQFIIDRLDLDGD